MARASLIITTHNRAHLLLRAVRSARSSGSSVEIVVVDDASSDDTAQVCQSFSDIKYVRVERNQGVAVARNIGLVASNCEYITFLDDDDVRLPQSLDRQIEALEKEPSAALVYGQAVFGDENGNPKDYRYPLRCPQGDIFWKLISQNFIPCGSAVFRRSCLTRIGTFEPTLTSLEDWDLWVRMAEIFPVVAVEVPVILLRQSTPTSRQLTSEAMKIASISLRQFRQWMRLPRAINASRKTKREVWRDFSENVVEHLIWESVRSLSLGNIARVLLNCLIAPRFAPLTIVRVAKRRLQKSSRTRMRESYAWRSLQS